MGMSNMNANRSNAKDKGTQSVKQIAVNQNRKKFQQEEFSSEFEYDMTSAQVNNFAGTQEKTDIKQPVSERTAWH